MSVIELSGSSTGLRLGTNDPLYVRSYGDGCVFIRAVSLSEEPESLDAAYQSRMDAQWTSVAEPLRVRGRLVVFDAALTSPAKSESFTLELDEGEYAVRWAVHRPDAETELLMVEIQKKY